MSPDENGNTHPAIYTRNTTNSADHIDQVGLVLAELRLLGFKSVSPEAYFDKCKFASFHQSRLDCVIHPLLKAKTSLPDDDNYVVFVYDVEDITLLSVDHFAELIQLIPEVSWSPLLFVINFLTSKIHNSTNYTGNESIPELFYKSELFKQLYKNISNGFDRNKSLISEDLLDLVGIIEKKAKQYFCEIIVEHQKVFNQRWRSVEKCLKWVQEMSNSNKKFANVVICKDTSRGAAELLFSGLSSAVPLENIFSERSILSPHPVFTRIQERFGKNCVMIHVNTNEENHRFHGNLQIPVWWISSNESFEQLYRAQRDILSD